MKFINSRLDNQLQTKKLKLKALRALRSNAPLIERWRKYNRITNVTKI